MFRSLALKAVKLFSYKNLLSRLGRYKMTWTLYFSRESFAAQTDLLLCTSLQTQPLKTKPLTQNLILPAGIQMETGTSPFKINVPQDILDDLKRRLKNTRWPDEIVNSGWDYGTNLSFLKELVTCLRQVNA